jgi:F-type H+-transporting ATPase subunit c
MEHLASVIVAGQIAAAIAVLTGSFTAIGQGNIVSKAIESMARQPEAAGTVRTSMFIGLAMAETGGIYGLLIAIILLFANPLVTRFVNLAAQFGL